MAVVVAFPAPGLATPAARQPIPARDMQPRVVGGLTFGQRRARIADLIAPTGPRSGSKAESAPVVEPPAAIAPPAPLGLTLRITRERLAVFATLATIEQRPLDEVIAECLADMAAHLARTRHRLHLDEQDRAQLDAYLDSLAAQQERAEMEREDATARAATTPAMRAAAYQSDLRATFPLDDESGDYEHRFQGAGYVELQMGMEG